MSNLKLLVVGDIHGKHEVVESAYSKFLSPSKNYDKIIFLGNYCHSSYRSDEDLYRTLRTLFDYREDCGDDFIILLGNHDIQYLYPEEREYRCYGFRQTAQPALKYLLNANRNKFQIAYQIENILFTNAGVTEKWYNKHLAKYKVIAERLDKDPYQNNDVGDVLNIIFETAAFRDTIAEVSPMQGGDRYSYGGPLWADKKELIEYGPKKGLIQYVGHNPVKDILRITEFDGKKDDNTSVTFCDVLDFKEQFVTVNIKTE